MPKLPAISGDKAVKCFEKLGYQVVRQHGSHIRFITNSIRTKSHSPSPAIKYSVKDCCGS
ncbi:MAG: type II toxin-antitoxin system HicA family toxin [Candidatus Omnitrophota bacterium]|nr:type II toxin-antitoxin system HicA family toxin [Candidatus Omnitrophota bacterium]